MTAHDRIKMTVEEAQRDKLEERIALLGTSINGKEAHISIHEYALAALNAADALERLKADAIVIESIRRNAWELALGARLLVP